MVNRFYSNTAVETQLTDAITESATSMQVGNTTGYPTSFPFTLIIDRETASSEIVEVTAQSGDTLTITRGIDGTSAFSHDLGAAVVHGVSARDFREPQVHLDDNDGVHGLPGTSQVVGTDATQTLINKTLTDPTVTDGSFTTPILDTPAIADFTSAQHDHGSAAKGGSIPQGSVTSLVSDLSDINSDISANTSDISANTTDISAHDTRIGDLESTASVLIERIDISSDTTTISFTNIPQDFTNLRIAVSTAGNPGGLVGAWLRFNDDSGNHYWSYFYSSAADDTHPNNDRLGTSTLYWGRVGQLRSDFTIHVNRYAESLATNVHAFGMAFNDQSADGLELVLGGGRYEVDANVTKIDLHLDGGHVFQGAATFCLYGDR